MFIFVEVQVSFRLEVLGAENSVSRGELSHDQAASGKITNEAAKHRVSDSGHGCEDGSRRDR